MDLVAQNQPRFQTHQALLVIGLQNDFVLPDGRLPVNTKNGFLERIQTLIPKFRDLNGNVIWVQTMYEADRIATDADTGEGDALVVGGLVDGYESSTEAGDEELAKDAKELKDMPAIPSKSSKQSSKHKQRALELLKRVSARRKVIPQEVARASAEQDDELFLLKSEKKMPACVPDTSGAQFADVIARQFEYPADMVIKTTHYSAFQGTNLLMTLRAKLVTELYICGCITNVSVLATVIDAARHGVKINVIEDCLGFRKQSRHDLALKRMDEFFDAYVVSSAEVLAKEPPATPPQKESTSPNGSRKSTLKGNEKPIEASLGKMSLNDDGRPSSRKSNPRSPAKVLTGKQRTLSLVSFAESRKAAQTPNPAPATDPIPVKELTDKQFAAKLVEGAKIPPPPPEPEEEEERKPGLVKSKIRMRSKSRKKKREKEKEKAKEEEAAKEKAEPGETVGRHSTAESVNTPQSPKAHFLARAGSFANLRDKEARQQRLKSVASVPVLNAKPVRNSEEKERNRLSDLSERVRLSFSRASKSDDSRKGLNILGSSRGPQSPTKSESRQSKRLSEAASLSSLSSPLAGDGSSAKSPTSPPPPRLEGRPSREVSFRQPESITARSPPLSRTTTQTSSVSKSTEPQTPTRSVQSPIASPTNIQPTSPPPQSTAVQPIAAQATVAQPSATQPTAIQPTTTQATATQAPATQPTATPPTAAQPTAAQAPSRSIPPTESPDTKPPTMTKTTKLQSLANLPVLGPGDKIAAGDSRIIHDFFAPDFCHPTDRSKPLKDLIFTQLYNEVRWQKMLHQTGEVPRLVCCQGAFGDDGSMPVYRHPTDQTLPLLHFSPKVQVIRRRAEKLVGHPLNHVLIQCYRSGNDFISEHSDKTLDIVQDSSIVNVSFGAQRTMRLRTKKVASATKSEDTATEESGQRETQRVPMPHNSMFVLGLESNEKWLHGIMADKRMASERHEDEKAYNGIRISLTFRNIGTFLDPRETTIWGHGATAKDKLDAADVINGDETENERLIRAFSKENHSSEFDWDEYYGEGFDVLHIQEPPQDLPILFASSIAIETRQVQMFLAEAKTAHTFMSPPALEAQYEGHREVTFRDNDTHHSEISASNAILLYLDRWYPLDRSDAGRPCTAAGHPIMRLATHLLICWNQHVRHSDDATAREEVQDSVAILEDMLVNEKWSFIAGRKFSVADCFVWPLIDDLVEKWEGWNEKTYPLLAAYYKTTWKKKACAKKLREKLGEAKRTRRKR